MALFCSSYSRQLEVSLLTATSWENFTFWLWNGLYDLCIHLSNTGKNVLLKLPIQLELAVKLLSWKCSAIQLDKVGSATASLSSIVHFSLVCRASSHCKRQKRSATCMETRNTPILVRVIHFQSLLGVVYLW